MDAALNPFNDLHKHAPPLRKQECQLENNNIWFFIFLYVCLVLVMASAVSWPLSLGFRFPMKSSRGDLGRLPSFESGWFAMLQ